jgi:mannose/cellobiose epimerase-like protein (N-acyl-D-glucosamine 2-epimerase family)
MNKDQLPETFSRPIENLLGFFNDNAWDSAKQVYYSEVDNEGKVVSGKIYTVALNRLIYGLSYTSQYYPENLAKAKSCANFLLNNLVGHDSIGDYFYSFTESNKADTSKTLDVWQQAYGLGGLSELYRITGDSVLLSHIHNLHQAFIRRFEDKERGGLYGGYIISSGQVSGSKTLQSLLYPITSYMANLWLADTANRNLYEPVIRKNLEIIRKIAWNAQTNWVNIKFDDSWKVCENIDEQNPCFTVSPGHNFQLASLFLRTPQWNFITDKEKQDYKTLGEEIIDATLKKPIFDNNIENGFFSLVNPINDKVLDNRKTWWQHCEAIIALSLCKGKYNKELEKLELFFFSHFPDYQLKGEYFYLDSNNKPVTSELKGSIGKSAYHTIEMIRFLQENEYNNHP